MQMKEEPSSPAQGAQAQAQAPAIDEKDEDQDAAGNHSAKAMTALTKDPR